MDESSREAWLNVLGARRYEDGMILNRCEKCGGARQEVADMLGVKVVRPIACKCMQDEYTAFKMRMETTAIDEATRKCFGSRYEGKKDEDFEHDDGSNVRYTNGMKAYVDNFDSIRNCSKNGFLLYGPVGTGKSFYAAEVANALLRKGKSAMYVSLAEIAARITNFRESKSEILDEIVRCDFLVLDDLGIERESQAMAEACWSVIDARYGSRQPMAITTNIDVREMMNERDRRKQSMYDRIFERCELFAINGPSKRIMRKPSEMDMIRGIMSGTKR